MATVGAMSIICLAGGPQMGLSPSPAAAGAALKVTGAWVPVADQVGRDLPLLMTIENGATNADALLRVRCPVANFSEKHTVDRGEGSPAMRAIASILVAANATMTLEPNGYHVMLLQTRQALAEGERFTCTIVFQRAGTVEAEVEVRASRSPQQRQSVR